MVFWGWLGSFGVVLVFNFYFLGAFHARFRTERPITASPRMRYRQQQASSLRFFTKMHVSRAVRDVCSRQSIGGNC